MKRHWLLGLFLVAAIAASCAPTLSPTSTPGTIAPELAYVGRDGGIYILDQATETSRRVSDPGNFTRPGWSPDGNWLAFVQGGDPWATDNEVWIVGRDGAEARKVADGYAPEWSNDSQLLFVTNFQQSEQGSPQSLIIYDLAANSEEELTTQFWMGGFWPLEEAVYSADGNWIAVYANGLEAEGRLFVIPAEGGQVQEIASFVYTVDNYDWSPIGPHLAYRDSGDPFRGDRAPFLMMLDVDEERLLADLEGGFFWPRWSPNGESIALFQIQEGSGFQVWTVFPNGAGLALINEETFQPIWGADPTWSPTGEWILFNALVDAETGEVGVYLMDPDSGRITLLTQGVSPIARWSPDGAWIAIASGPEDGREIFLVAPDGTGLHKVADGDFPAWRP